MNSTQVIEWAVRTARGLGVRSPGEALLYGIIIIGLAVVLKVVYDDTGANKR